MKYHLIGSEGISMQGVKKYLEFLGHTVTGSDIKTGGHKKENITKDIDVVVRTSAVSPGSPGWCEVEASEALGIKVLKRSELLGQLTQNKKLITISGMHGKTTVTSMLGILLIKAGFDPTVLVGERVKEFNDDVIRIGKSDWFVLEACEYDRSFLDFNPKIAVLTNIEEEHLDTYPEGMPEIKQAFKEFLEKVDEEGVIVANHDDDNLLEVVENLDNKAKVIYFGKTSDKYNKIDFQLGLPGEHNRLNAMSVLALADYLKIDEKIIQEVLENFHGAKRRFEDKGNFNGCEIIDDYGHHPSEIEATLKALKEKFPDKKRVVVFWPHQYKRIKPLIKNFAKAFELADEIIIKPIFFVPGRDTEMDVSSGDIIKLLKDKSKKATLMKDDNDIVKYLKTILNKDKVLLTIGIPPVYKIADAIKDKK